MNTESSSVRSTQEYKVVGTRPVRHDGLDKVTGRARFGADLQMPGLLHGKVLRSPHAHARIKSIDASRALALPGVRAVITAADLPEPSARFEDQVEGTLFNYGFYSRNVLASEKVLYRGPAFAAVAATGSILEGGGWSQIGQWIQLMLVFDILFLVISSFTFELVLGE